MSGRPRTTSFAEQNKQSNQQPAVLGMKVTSKLTFLQQIPIIISYDNRLALSKFM